MKADKGTPELQEKRAQLKGRREGLEYIYSQKTIDWEQYGAGLVYAAAFNARFASFAPKSCLANLCHIPSQEAWVAGQRWLALMDVCDAATLHDKLLAAMTARSKQAPKEQWSVIISRIAGHDDWSVEHVAQACQVHGNTAREYVRRAFDMLVECIDQIERKGMAH